MSLIADISTTYPEIKRHNASLLIDAAIMALEQVENFDDNTTCSVLDAIKDLREIYYLHIPVDLAAKQNERGFRIWE